MNLDNMLELDKLKQKHSEISQQIIDVIMAKKRACLESVRKDFNDYFESKGFKINSSINLNNSMRAQHGNINVTLQLPKADENYIGAYSVFELSIDGPIKKSYNIVVNELGHYPSISSTISTVKQLSEDEKILMEIEKEKKSIDEALKTLPQKQNMKLGFGRKIKDEKKIAGYPQFETFYALLEDTFK